ncbi:MAG TPA: S41 family peptidase, partial [Verrucomicrobiales bacterium]|nr:S41 family peptidase [Verrucomicrobiales bacterium]
MRDVPGKLTVPAAGLLLLLTGFSLHAEVTLLSKGEKTTWRYFDSKAAPGKDWTAPGFDDSKWKSGKGPVGYGERGLGTTLSFGSDPANKPLTAWFRTTFTAGAKDLKRFEKLEIRLQRDDGAIVYINGKEAARSNLPAGDVDASTEAETAIDEEDENRVHPFTVPVSLLTEGANTVAVEVHQAYARSSDLFLDLEIAGYLPGEAPQRDFYRDGMAAVSRGDYPEAAQLLAQVPPAHPAYAKTMAMLGWQIYGEMLKKPAEGLPFVRKGYEAAPADRDVVRAYIKTHVLSGAIFDPKDIARERKKEVPKEYAFLITKPKMEDSSKKFPRAKLEADLDYLEQVLAKCFAYLELRPVDYRAALDAIRQSLDDTTTVNAFEIRIAKLISLFCDGHAHMAHHESQFLPEGYAPYIAGSYKGKVFLANASGTGFLDPGHPWLTAIDGKPVEEWMKVAGYLVVKESPQWHLRGTLEMLRYVTYLRAELGLPQNEEIKLTLQSADGKSSGAMEVKVQSRPLRGLTFPRGESREIDGIGYLRIAQMSSGQRSRSPFDEWMQKFRDTKGLIIDVRGNTGGTKDILHALFPYF